MTRFPPLYKRASTGKIQSWQIEVDGNKLRTISGIHQGKLVQSAWTECEIKNGGKTNATTPEEQAVKEAESRWRKKFEAAYFKDIAEIDKLEFKEPMLAKEYEDYAEEIEFPIFTQPKLDGIRCIVTKDGMTSRNNKPIVGAPHIREDLDEVFKAFPNIEFDGELYNHNLKNDFDSIVSFVRKQKPSKDELKESSKVIKYYIYDIRDPEALFSSRNETIKNLFQKFELDDSLVNLKTDTAKSEKGLMKLYSKYKTDGYEGLMVRTDSLYEFKRSKHLLKLKEFITEEFIILDIIEGIGNRSGMVGKLRFEKDSATFEANIRGTHEYYKDLLQRKNDVIGKSATVRYQNLTPPPNPVPRFPVVIQIAREDYE